MKFIFFLAGKLFSFEFTRSIEHYTKVNRRDNMKQQRILLQIDKKKQAQGGNTYTNCSFGNPFPVSIPVQVPDIRGNDDDAFIKATEATGIPKEMIERAVLAVRQYYLDKNSPEKP
jgi:hypothetical protein